MKIISPKPPTYHQHHTVPKTFFNKHHTPPQPTHHPTANTHGMVDVNALDTPLGKRRNSRQYFYLVIDFKQLKYLSALMDMN